MSPYEVWLMQYVNSWRTSSIKLIYGHKIGTVVPGEKINSLLEWEVSYG